MKKVFLFIVIMNLSVQSVFAQPVREDGNENLTLAFPNLTVTVNNNPSPEYLFLGPASSGSS